jgi:transcriptional regulator with XRE-family HTH domain
MTALWTIDDDEDFGPTLISPMGTRCRARDMGVTDGSFAALVADVRAARLAADLAAVPALVRAKRERDGLSYRELAALVGIAPSLLHRYEHGHSEPTLSNLVKLIRWLLSEPNVVAARRLARQQQPRRHCPDDGTCHHECGTGPCWRVNNAGPLSGVFPGDEWPDHARQEEGTDG